MSSVRFGGEKMIVNGHKLVDNKERGIRRLLGNNNTAM